MTKPKSNYNISMIFVPSKSKWVGDSREAGGGSHYFYYFTNPQKTGIITRVATAEILAVEVADLLKVDVEIHTWNLLKSGLHTVTSVKPGWIAGA